MPIALVQDVYVIDKGSTVAAHPKDLQKRRAVVQPQPPRYIDGVLAKLVTSAANGARRLP